MLAEETRLLTQRTQITKAGRRLTSLIIVGGVFVGATLLAPARLAVNREIGINAWARAQIGILNSGLEQRAEEWKAALESEIAERQAGRRGGERKPCDQREDAQKLANQKFALDKHAIVEVTDVQGIITYVNERFCAISE